MQFITKIKDIIASWEKKDFYIYVGTFIGFFVLMTLAIVFYSRYKTNGLRREIDNINELRESDVKKILTDARDIDRQKEEISEILAQDKNFKIGEIFKGLLKQLGISDKQEGLTTISRSEREDIYTEEKLQARLINMNMQQLTELLHEIEQSKRIYAKELEITKSLKKANTIEVSITIATLQPKAQKAELAE